MIKIVVDSASDIDMKEAKTRGFELLSMRVQIDGVEYLDGVDISGHEFFEKLIECNDIPKTSQINEFTFDEKFKEITDESNEALCIVISSKLSGTFSSAKKAAKKYGSKVVVIDSEEAALGERILIDYAEKLVQEGKSLSEIEKILNEKKGKIKLLALLGTLKYLKKGGRINPLVAFAGEAISLKPVIAVEKGEIKLVGKAIGSKKGNNLLMKLVDDCGGIDYNMPYCVAYSGLDDSVLQKYLKDSASLWEGKAKFTPRLIGSTIGTHIGPGAIAVAFFAK